MGFISGICAPCYSLLDKLIPETNDLIAGVHRNLERWKIIAAENKKKNEDGTSENRSSSSPKAIEDKDSSDESRSSSRSSKDSSGEN